MELNREQIIKALEWCSELRLCVDCPMRAEGYFSHSGNACRKALMENSLSLIKELTEENERLMREKTALECVVSTARNQAKAAAVQKMKERLINYESYDNGGGNYVVSVCDIRQVAKEMEEGS